MEQWLVNEEISDVEVYRIELYRLGSVTEHEFCEQ